jgi:hypothetical protein
MAALDRDHHIVRRALEKEGWTVTDDPLTLEYKERRLQVDLGAERLLVAEKGTERIAVEIKTFSGPSDVTELYHATGQFVVYETLLKNIDPSRILFLAVPDDVLYSLFENDLGEILLENKILRVFGYNIHTEEITEWKI